MDTGVAGSIIKPDYLTLPNKWLSKLNETSTGKEEGAQ